MSVQCREGEGEGKLTLVRAHWCVRVGGVARAPVLDSPRRAQAPFSEASRAFDKGYPVRTGCGSSASTRSLARVHSVPFSAWHLSATACGEWDSADARCGPVGRVPGSMVGMRADTPSRALRSSSVFVTPCLAVSLECPPGLAGVEAATHAESSREPR